MASPSPGMYLTPPPMSQLALGGLVASSGCAHNGVFMHPNHSARWGDSRIFLRRHRATASQIPLPF